MRADKETVRAADLARAQALLPSVSRETWDRLAGLVALVDKWQPVVNLVAPKTLDEIWTRHVADSLQLVPLVDDPSVWVDFGSGGGFPGLVVAAALVGSGARVHLVESDQRKAAFLREAARTLGLPAQVHAQRFEAFTDRWQERTTVVSARAVAALSVLLPLAYPLLKTGALGVFPKGQDVEQELTDSAKSWIIDARLIPSVTDPKARIVLVAGVEPRRGNSA